MKKTLTIIAASLLLIGCGGGTAETLKTTTTTEVTTTTEAPTTTVYSGSRREDSYLDSLENNGVALSSGDTDVQLGETICEIFDAAGVNGTSIMVIFDTFEDYGFYDEAAPYIVAATRFLCPEYQTKVEAWASEVAVTS